MTARLAIIKSTTPKELAKRFYLGTDGALAKAPGGALSEGTAETRDVGTPDALAALLHELGPDAALTFGVPARDGTVVATARLSAHPGAISRTREHWHWPAGSGWMLLDHDDTKPFDELLLALVAAMPELGGAPLVAVPSASSCIYRVDGAELRGVRGWHLFVLVEDAAAIPTIGATLIQRLWLAGRGRISVSKSGAALRRTLIDAAVWQPERLSFDGGAALGPGLVQRRLDHLRIINATAAPMGTPASLSPKDAAEVNRLIKEAIAEAQPEVEAAQELWVDERLAATLKTAPTTDAEALRETLKLAVRRRELMGDFEILLESGKTVTIGTLLDAPEKWHNARCSDPLEPDYRGDNRVAVILLCDGKPRIYSHAHGGCTYALRRQTRGMLLEDGQYPRQTREILDRLGAERSIYQRGGTLCHAQGGKIVASSVPLVAHAAEQSFAFRKFDARSGQERPCQMPVELAQRLLVAQDCWAGVPTLRAVVSHPLVTSDGRLLAHDGFYPDAGILIETGRTQSIPDRPTREQVMTAIDTLWRPISLMPYEDASDAGAALALLLTAVVRPVLDLAPLFITAAPSYGSGKTLLSQVASLVAGGDGEVTVISPHEEEQSKSVLSILMAGTPAVILDNLSGELKGDALAAAMTARTFQGRLLGKSQMIEAENASLWMATGVNVSPSADLVRRCITIRLDPREEKPEERVFAFDPVLLARETLPLMQTAAVIILLAAHQAGAWQIKPARGVGSFEAWDIMIRRTVLWLAAEGLTPCEMADPLLTQTRAREHDDEAATLSALLHAWRAYAGPEAIGASALLDRCRWAPNDPDAEEILRVALEVAGAGSTINAKRWGRYLARHRGRVVDGMTLEQPLTRAGVRCWKVAFSGFSGINYPTSWKCHEHHIDDDTSENAPKNDPESHLKPPRCPRCDGAGCRHCRQTAGARL
jgi:hypothetical protein